MAIFFLQGSKTPIDETGQRKAEGAGSANQARPDVGAHRRGCQGGTPGILRWDTSLSLGPLLCACVCV